MALVDLHLHTTASDGRLTPTELVDLAAGQGLKVIAITDHDSTEGLPEAFEAARKHPDLTVIPGIELSADVPGNEIHILGYYIRHQDPKVQETLTQFRQGRQDRGRRMVERLREMGMGITWERVQELAGEAAIGRPHVAQALVEGGWVRDTDDAFEKYIGRNSPAYTERAKLSPTDAIDLIKSWGGVPVMAHPIYVDDYLNYVADLKDAGLVGIEVHYAKFSREQIEELARVADRFGLVACGGTDYHAIPDRTEYLPGASGPPTETVEQLKRHARKG